jgi:hypothetical protein
MALFNMNMISRIQEIGLVMVSLTFLLAAVAKLNSRNDFKMTLWQIPYLPPVFVPMIHLLLPPAEIIIAIGLMLCLDVAKLAAIVLLLSFCLLAIVVMKAKLKVPCNCFGSGDRSFSIWTIAQNLGLIALICIGISVKHTQEILLDVLTGAVFLIVGLSAFTFWSNRKMVEELRRLNIV